MRSAAGTVAIGVCGNPVCLRSRTGRWFNSFKRLVKIAWENAIVVWRQWLARLVWHANSMVFCIKVCFGQKPARFPMRPDVLPFISQVFRKCAKMSKNLRRNRKLFATFCGASAAASAVNRPCFCSARFCNKLEFIALVIPAAPAHNASHAKIISMPRVC